MSWVTFEDKTLAMGFTQIPNAIVRNPNLSMQAKYLYGLLLSYAWEDPSCFPGQKRLANDAGVKKLETLRAYLYELVDAGVLDIERRGQGKTNRYAFKALTSGSDTPQKGVSRNPEKGANKKPRKRGYNEDTEKESPPTEGTAVPSRAKSKPENKSENKEPVWPGDESKVSEKQSYFIAYLHNRLDERELLEDKPITNSYKKQLAGELATHLNKGYRRGRILAGIDYIVFRWRIERVGLTIGVDRAEAQDKVRKIRPDIDTSETAMTSSVRGMTID